MKTDLETRTQSKILHTNALSPKRVSVTVREAAEPGERCYNKARAKYLSWLRSRNPMETSVTETRI